MKRSNYYSRKRYGFIDKANLQCTCYHCHKVYKFHQFYGLKWLYAKLLCQKSWRWSDKFRKWFCPACKLLPQYHQITAKILMKGLK